MNATGAGARPRVVAIVQARMGSTRLPGKVLRDIAGRPLLWHIVHRLRSCRTLDAIAVATTNNPRDDAIENFCREEGIACVRGSEDNVLARFVQAASATNADIIVRVCSDAPFIDAPFIDRLVQRLIHEDGDYVIPDPSSPCAHQGVDPFSRRALEKLAREVPDDAIAREHVTGYFKLHPDFARVVHAPADARLAHASARLTIDTPDDLAFAEALHDRLSAKAGEASLADLLLLLEREPHLKAMNAHVRQKNLIAQGGLALIRCDGGGTLGYGHVKRGVALARALRDGQGVGAIFALNGDESAAAVLREAGFECVTLPQFAQTNALALLIEDRKPDILICDARQNLTEAALKRLAARVPVAAVIDDISERRLVATHAYFSPLPQVAALNWGKSKCRVRVGWEWSVLGFDPTRVHAEKPKSDRPRIVVSMGGSDPFDLTRLAARALAKIGAPLSVRFVIGPGFRGAAALTRAIEALNPNFETVQGVADLGAEFAAADLALIAFGVTAYELAALGVPGLYLALSEDHALSASAFERNGMGTLLGLARVCRAEHIAKTVWELITDETRRRDMRAAGLNAIDGRGAERIAVDLVDALAETRGVAKAG